MANPKRIKVVIEVDAYPRPMAGKRVTVWDARIGDVRATGEASPREAAAALSRDLASIAGELQPGVVIGPCGRTYVATRQGCSDTGEHQVYIAIYWRDEHGRTRGGSGMGRSLRPGETLQEAAQDYCNAVNR